MHLILIGLGLGASLATIEQAATQWRHRDRRTH